MFARLGRALPWIVVFGWLAGIATAFWYFEFRPQGNFAAPGLAAAGDTGQRELAQRWFQRLRDNSSAPPLGAALTVVHVYQDRCDCNRFTDGHLAEIQARFRDRGVRFMRVQRGSSASSGMPGWVSSLPAAFVFGADGALLYFGPYSDAAWCGRSGAMVENVLDRALQGMPPLPPVIAAWGCFCEAI